TKRRAEELLLISTPLVAGLGISDRLDAPVGADLHDDGGTGGRRPRENEVDGVHAQLAGAALEQRTHGVGTRGPLLPYAGAGGADHDGRRALGLAHEDHVASVAGRGRNDLAHGHPRAQARTERLGVAARDADAPETAAESEHAESDRPETAAAQRPPRRPGRRRLRRSRGDFGRSGWIHGRLRVYHAGRLSARALTRGTHPS